MKHLIRFTFLAATLFISCSDDDALEAKTDLLVDVQWFNSRIVGSSPTGYSVSSPVVFKRDKSFSTGGSKGEWQFVEEGKSVRITFPGSTHTTKYEIVNLTEKEFHFKVYDHSGKFMIELVYDKCSGLTFTPC